MTPTHRSHDMTIESAPDLPSQLAVKVMHEIGSNDPDLYGRLQETLSAALVAAPQPAPDEFEDCTGYPVEDGLGENDPAPEPKVIGKLGWGSEMTPPHKYSPDYDAITNECRICGYNKEAHQTEPQPAPVEREALVDVVAEELRATLGTTEATWLAEDVADALLARGPRLPAPETMAWAVIGRDGKLVGINYDRMTAQHLCNPGERVVRVVIRVVEGGDE